MSEAMAGAGDYDRHSEHQVRDARSRADVVRDAAARLDPAGMAVLVDYGCGQGRTSNALLKIAVEQIRDDHRDVPIGVVHNDLLANDWATLFAHLRAEDSYLHVAGGPITPMASATSFYDPVTPLGVVDLGMSFAAAQWLAEPGPAEPGPAGTGSAGTGSALYYDQLTGEPRAAMAARADADWRLFLDRRADELRSGGRIVMALMGASDEGAAAHDAWRIARELAEELVAEGILDRDRLDRYVLPVYERSLEEVRRPFAGRVGERLEIEHLAMHDSLSPAIAQYRDDGDAAAFATGFLGFFRAFSEPSLRAALDPTGAATDELYRRMEGRLRDEAGDFDFTVHLVTMVCTRL